MQKALNLYIDQTLLKPEATQEEIQKFCKESIKFQFATVFVHPIWAALAHQILHGTTVKLGCPVGFPLGANTKETKAFEARQLVECGAKELDMVLNIGALKSKDYQEVQKDIEAVVKAAPKALIKVIIETCLLTDEEKQIASKIIQDAGAHFVKTSTGFSKSGANVHDVAILRKAVGPNFGVKASGGIRDLETALAMIDAGASRIGTSAGVAILQAKKELTATGSY